MRIVFIGGQEGRKVRKVKASEMTELPPDCWTTMRFEMCQLKIDIWYWFSVTTLPTSHKQAKA